MIIDDPSGAVRDYFDSCSSHTDSLERLGRACQEGAVSRLVDFLADGHGSVDALASRSQHHPLGFDKLLLCEGSDYQIRAHIWYADRQPGREDIHDHRFDLYSYLVTGRLVVETFSYDPAGLPMGQYQEQHIPGKGGYQFIFKQSVNVVPSGISMTLPGCAYYTAADVLHRVNPELRHPVMTVFLKRVVKTKDATVVLTPTELDRLPVGSLPSSFSLMEYREKLRQLRQVLA